MNDLLSKLSSYHIFNYLLPGILFVVILQVLTPYSLVQSDIVLGVFVYYFTGMVISRLGSLVVEPLLKYVSFVKFADYPSYIAAAKADPSVETLSETNNTYRTLVAMFVLLLVAKVYTIAAHWFPSLNEQGPVILAFALLVMFLFAYRKQTAYVVKRINAAQSQK